jgi:hypothetical protein
MNRKPATTAYEGSYDFDELNGVDPHIVTVDDQVLDPRPSLKLRNHSPTGFAWGYMGSGPSQLALALLLDYYGDEDYALRHYMKFKEVAVGIWDKDAAWSFTGADFDNIMAVIE